MPALQPTFRFLLAHPAHFIALGFGSGLAPWAPGTFGSLAAVPLYLGLALLMPPLWIALLAIPAFFLGIWACERTGRALGVSDHGAIVIDEIVAMLPLLALAPQDWRGMLVALGLFRLFDIWKPWPIRWFDRHLKGGLGVMVDDAVAALFAVPFLAWWGYTAF
ncbi:phosphatidylglycerophosphatase A family protein [Chitinimonas lacunae]|uniref:Phosphatidylglycerophosphatase A n=1 Tax=Chitinimonas lacunae TaxID=1963018 RepID=A0ABV8MK33_9NEIS